MLFVNRTEYEPGTKPDGNCATIAVSLKETTVRATPLKTIWGMSPSGLKVFPEIVIWLAE